MVHVFSEHLSPVEESAGNNTTEGRNDLANSSTTFNTSQRACVSLTWFHSVANNFSQLRFAMHFLPFGPVKERRPAGSKLQACVSAIMRGGLSAPKPTPSNPVGGEPV